MNRLFIRLLISEFALKSVPLLAFVSIFHATHYQNFTHNKAKNRREGNKA